MIFISSRGPQARDHSGFFRFHRTEKLIPSASYHDAIFVRPTARSVGASPAAPLGGIRQHEQVQTGEQEQGEREHR